MCAVVCGLGGMAACGGRVVIDKEAPDEPGTACEKLCDKFAACGGETGEECVDQCVQGLDVGPAACRDELLGVYECIVDVPDQEDCDYSSFCLSETIAYGDCISGSGTGGIGGIGGAGVGGGSGAGGFGGGSASCDFTECSEGSDGSCQCKGFCAGQDVFINCAPQGNASVCQCFASGNDLGSCASPSVTCGIESSCCADLL